MSLTDLGITCITGGSDLDFQHLLYVTDQNTCVILFSVLGELRDMKEQTDRVWLITNAANPKMASFIKNVIHIPQFASADTNHITPHCITMIFTEILTAYIAEMKQQR